MIVGELTKDAGVCMGGGGRKITTTPRRSDMEGKRWGNEEGNLQVRPGGGVFGLSKGLYRYQKAEKGGGERNDKSIPLGITYHPL